MESKAQSGGKVAEKRGSKGEKDYVLYLEKFFQNQIFFPNTAVVPFTIFSFLLLDLDMF